MEERWCRGVDGTGEEHEAFREDISCEANMESKYSPETISELTYRRTV